MYMSKAGVLSWLCDATVHFTEKSFLKAARLTNRGFSLKQNSGCKLFFRDFNEAAIMYDLICVMSRLAIIQVLKFYNRPKFPV